jgi:hypothetical protein
MAFSKNQSYDILLSCWRARRPILKSAQAAAVASGNNTINNLVSIVSYVVSGIYYTGYYYTSFAPFILKFSKAFF